MKRSVAALIAAAIAASVALTGCGGKKADPTNVSTGTPVKGGTFTVANTSDVSNLNPILNQDSVSGAIIDKVFDTLLHTNEKLEFTPWLATELPKVENNGLKWTFKLRGDVKWHDGAEFSSKDVKFTFGAILHPGYTGVRASGLTAIKGADALRKGYKAIDADVKAGKLSKEEGDKQKAAAWQAWYDGDAIQTPDKTTVIFNLDQTFAPAMSNIGLRGILPEHLLKDQLGAKMKDSEFNRKPVGTGRYTFVEWKPNERVVLKANDSWWGGRPNIDQYIARVFPDVNTAMAALEKGEVDEAAIQPEQVDRFKKDVQSVATFEYQTNSYQYVAFDQKNPLFQDKNVRQALTYAVDKETLVSKVLMGHGIPAWSHGTPIRWDYNPKVPKFTFDKAKAEKMLDDAGWKKGPDGIRAKDGKKFSFELYYISSQKAYADAAQVVQAAWKEVGVDANLKGIDEPTLLDMIDVGNPQHKEPPAQIYGWNLGNEPDSYAIWACDGTFNDISYCNKDVDELLKKGRTELDQSKRAVIYQELQAKLTEDQPYMFLWFKNALYGVNKRVRGPIVGNPNGLEYNIEKWWINPAAGK